MTRLTLNACKKVHHARPHGVVAVSLQDEAAPLRREKVGRLALMVV